MVCLLATFLVSSSDSGGSVVAKQPSPLLNPPTLPPGSHRLFEKGKRETHDVHTHITHFFLEQNYDIKNKE